MPPLRRLVAALLVAGLGVPAASGAATPGIATAPGRVVLQVDDGRLLHRSQGTGGRIQPTVGILHTAALTDGSTLLLGNGTAGSAVMYAAKLGPDGALHRSFGAGGTVAFDAPGGAWFYTRQILPQPDGRVLVLFTAGREQRVTRLNADMTVDRSYGVDGVARTSIACALCVARQQPDGALVVSGEGGLVATSTPLQPGRPSAFWVLTRLTPNGSTDRAFGADGIATIPMAGHVTGSDIALGPDGTIVATGVELTAYDIAYKLWATRLDSRGAPDPTFAGGSPIEVPAFHEGGELFMQEDGAFVIAGMVRDNGPGAPESGQLARYTAAGARDLTYGSGGVVNLGAVHQLLPAVDGGVLAVGSPSLSVNKLAVKTVLADGSIDPRLTRDVAFAFGGGASGAALGIVPGLIQSSFAKSSLTQALVRRANGSYLAPGAVSIASPDGSMGRWAVAALTPAFEPDLSFGGPASPLGLSVAAVRQSARRAFARRTILVDLRATAIGLALVRVTHGSRTIARSLIPILSTDRARVAVALTSYGRALLHNHRNLRVVVRATGRDLLTTTSAATARGRLR